MAVKVGINGFGRIGRNIMRAAMGDSSIDIVAVNDLTDARTLAHLLKYDSILGNLKADISAQRRPDHRRRRRVPGALGQGPGAAAVEGRSASTSCSSRPASSPTATRRPSTSTAGAKKVVITAPAKKPDITVVLGVNEDKYDAGEASHHLERVVHDELPGAGRQGAARDVRHPKGWMTTVHSYTNDQQLLDLPHKDLRRARAAALSIIPTTTGAATAVGEVLPELKGKLDGIAMRVPTPNVSVVDLAAIARQEDDDRRGQRGVQGRGRRPAQGHPRVRRGAARLDRLPRQPALVDRRRAPTRA